MAKVVKLAWIEQILQFDTWEEYEKYIYKLTSGRPQQFRIIGVENTREGKVMLHIRKQYNNNQIPGIGADGNGVFNIQEDMVNT